MRQVNFFGGKIAILFAILLGISSFATGCASSGAARGAEETTGGGETAATALTLNATVALPSSASLSVAGLSAGLISPLTKTVVEDETAGAGVTCILEMLDGTDVATVTTSDTGVAEFDLTEAQVAQIEDGYVIVADNGTVPIHSYEVLDAEVIAEAEAAAAGTGDAPTEAAEVSPDTDIAYAVLQEASGGDIAAYEVTTDTRCVSEMTHSLLADQGTIGADSMGGYAATLREAHRAAFLNAQPGDNPATLMRGALAGDPSAFEARAGSTAGDVPVTDAITNIGSTISTMVQAYCDQSSGGLSTWAGTRTAAVAAGETFQPQALVRFVGDFTPAEFMELSSTAVAAFRGIASGIPTMPGAFDLMRGSSQARAGMVGAFRAGMFNNGTLADTNSVERNSAALGFAFAAFPPPPAGGRYIVDQMDWSNFDASRGMMAAANGFLDYAGTATTFARPRDIFTNFNTYLSDVDNQRALVASGTAFHGFISGFVDRPDFNPEEFSEAILMPPGGVCETSDDCGPCDTCVSSICTSQSTMTGMTCTDNDDCDGATVCRGGFIAAIGAHCECEAGMATGAFVYGAAATPGAGPGPMAYGMEGGFERRAQSNQCGNSLPSCPAGFSCFGDVANDHGFCGPSSTFQVASFGYCGSDDQCASGSCLNNVCAFDAAGTTTAMNGMALKAVGEDCAFPMECQSHFCIDLLCAAPPTTFQMYVPTGTTFESVPGGETVMVEHASGGCFGAFDCPSGQICMGMDFTQRLPGTCTVGGGSGGAAGSGGMAGMGGMGGSGGAGGSGGSGGSGGAGLVNHAGTWLIIASPNEMNCTPPQQSGATIVFTGASAPWESDPMGYQLGAAEGSCALMTSSGPCTACTRGSGLGDVNSVINATGCPGSLPDNCSISIRKTAN